MEVWKYGSTANRFTRRSFSEGGPTKSEPEVQTKLHGKRI
jgi:hypothetical protein